VEKSDASPFRVEHQDPRIPETRYCGDEPFTRHTKLKVANMKKENVLLITENSTIKLGFTEAEDRVG